MLKNIMEIKLITTDVTTLGGGVKFRFLGNVEIKKTPILFGTTKKSYQTVGFRFNDVETTVNSNYGGYFELYRDSDEPITQFSKGRNYGRLKTLNVSNLDTSQVTDMRMTFNGCSSLASLDVSNWNTSKVTDMYAMFSHCDTLTSLDVSHFDTSKVTNMSYMFNGCSKLTSLDLFNWNISKVTNMNHMFVNCRSLASLNLSNWDTSNVTNMYGMFSNCESLTSLDVSNWNISQVTDIDIMFSYCISLRTIKINDEVSANKLIAQIKKYLNKTATWNPETKIITISA